MKLKKFLKNIDYFTDVVIWDQVGLNHEEWEVIYEGGLDNIPWHYADRHLIKPKDNSGSEAACPFIDEKTGKVKLRITLADEVDNEE